MLNVVYLIIGDTFECYSVSNNKPLEMIYMRERRLSKIYAANSDKVMAYKIGRGIANSYNYSPYISVYPAYIKDCDIPIEISKYTKLYVLLVQRQISNEVYDEIQTVYYAVFVDKNNAIKEGEMKMKELEKYNDPSIHYSIDEVKYYNPKVYSYDDL